jgi:hypothetical protein
MNPSSPVDMIPAWAASLLVVAFFLGFLFRYRKVISKWYSSVCRRIAWLFSLKSQRRENRQLDQQGCNERLHENLPKVPKEVHAAGFLDNHDAIHILVDRSVTEFKRIELHGLTYYKIHQYDRRHAFKVLVDYVDNLPPVFGTADIFDSNKNLGKSLRLFTLCAIVKKTGGAGYFKKQMKSKKDEILRDRSTYLCYRNWGEANSWMQKNQVDVADLPIRIRRLILHIVEQLSEPNLDGIELNA